MKFLVVPQKFHGGEIQTISLNSSGKLIASGGKDHAICIWKADELTRLTRVDSTSLPEISPQISLAIHENTVKLIRWCPTVDSLFISASKDGTLILSDIELMTHKRIYTGLSLNKESAGEILDGCWSPDGRIFAWSSLNGKVHLYDTKKDTHQYLVKGDTEPTEKKVTVQQSIAFGPTFNCLVCMGDDMLVQTFEYGYDQHDNYQFKMVKKISRFVRSRVADNTNLSYKRISWSCDGEFVAVLNAANQLSSLITLLSSSNSWATKVSLLGHEALCNSVIFAPRILQSDGPVQLTDTTAQEPDPYHVIATTGSDNTLVLWNTSKELPIAVLKNASLKPITEILWANSGQDLIMVSLDGHFILIGFVENELGRVAPAKVLEDIVASQKILILASSSTDGNTKDSPASKKIKLMYPVVDQKNATSIHSLNTEAAEEDDIVETLCTYTSKVNPKVSDSEALVTDIIPRTPSSEPIKTHVDAKFPTSRGENENSQTTLSDTVKVVKNTTLKKSPQNNNGPMQKVTLKNGKKRIEPTLLSNQSSLPSQVAVFKSVQNDISETKPAMEFDKPSLLVSDDQLNGKKSKKPADSSTSKKAKRELEAVRYIGSVITNPNTSFAKARLSTPRIRHEFRISDNVSFLDIKNGQGNEHAPSRISNFKNDLQVWTDFVPNYIQLAVEGEGFWAVSTSDGQIITYTRASGKRLLPPLVLGSPISFLESKGKYLMAVTCIAEVYVWDLKQKKSHIKTPLSLASLLDLNMKFKDDTLSKSDSITMCSLTSLGYPLVTLSNGSGYVYNPDMEVWQTVTETWWAFGSHYWDSIGDDQISAEAHSDRNLKDQKQYSLISLLEHRTNEELLKKSRSGRGKYFSKISKNMIMKEGFENLENTISLSHLENRILCSELLGEQADFRHFLTIYAKRLCELGLKAKLFEVCELILGQNSQKSNSETKICGLERKGLLKEIIIACAEHRDAQRILVHFGQKIGLVDLEYD